MVRAFSHAGCRYCIAPLHDTFFEDAAIFLALFYKFLVGEKSSPWIIQEYDDWIVPRFS